ncbi:unnamed protein product [Rodentolepis nana]|uniref:CARD domain-containing protein n=1 Tax=Rodentolepis nana TaxID=102285 RepID=A0A0R3TTX5_RODNA|nr:unnamed protein product [Rodentolepis nana]
MKANSIEDNPNEQNSPITSRLDPDLIRILKDANILNNLVLKQCDPRNFQTVDRGKYKNQHGKKLADLVAKAKQLLHFLFPKFTANSAQLFEYLAQPL